MSKRWVVYDWMSLPRDLLNVPGCYVVIAEGVAQYVGSTSNIYKRLNAHGELRVLYGASVETPWGIFLASDFRIKISYSVKYGDWAMRELRLIRRLQPSRNQAYKRMVKVAV